LTAKLWLHDMVQCIEPVINKAAAMGFFDEDLSEESDKAVRLAMKQSITKFARQANDS